MFKYITIWLELSKINKYSVLRIDHALRNNKPEGLEQKELLLYKYCYSSFELGNFSIFPNFFQTILKATSSYFNKLNNHHQNRGVKNLQQIIEDKFGLEFLQYLWAVEIFKFFVNNSSDYVLDLDAPIKSQASKIHTVTMIEALLKITSEIETKIGLLWGLGELAEFYNAELPIKKSIHIIINEVARHYGNIEFGVYTKELNSVTTSNQFRALKLNRLDYDQTGSSERKITLISFSFDFQVEKFNYYKVYPTVSKIIQKGEVAWVVQDLYFICHYTIIQRFDREPTIVKPLAYQRLESLHKTAFYLNTEMLNATKELVFSELVHLDQQKNTCIEKLIKLKPESLPEITTSCLSDLMSFIIGLQKQQDFSRLVTEQKIVGVIKNQETNKGDVKTVGDFIKRQTQDELVLQRWVNIVKHSKLLQSMLVDLQKVLSYVSLYSKFLDFYNYIVNIESPIHFSVYLDFRGRVYYKSPVSIQAHWCYRFIYHFGDLDSSDLQSNSYILNNVTKPIFKDLYKNLNLTNPNYLEIFQSLGFLYKSSLTEEFGKIPLEKVIRCGLEFFTKNRNTTVLNLKTISGDVKTTVESFYYISIINSLERGLLKKFYIIKDTTCSMAQHGGKILGYNLKNLHTLNLKNSEEACDTYAVFITELKKLLFQANETLWKPLDTLLNRKLLKQLIMTSEYGVSQVTARSEFMETVRELSQTNPLYKVFYDPKYFEQLYDLLNNGFLDEYFYLERKENFIKKQMAEPYKTLLLDDLEMPIIYYNKIPITLYYTKNSDNRERSTVNVFFNVAVNIETYKSLLKTKKFSKLKELNRRKMRTAIYVNILHALDALYLRAIVEKCGEAGIPIATIHDGFAIPFNRGTWILTVANICFFTGLDNGVLYYSKETHPYIDSETIIV